MDITSGIKKAYFFIIHTAWLPANRVFGKQDNYRCLTTLVADMITHEGHVKRSIDEIGAPYNENNQ
ncbi:MAG TPA: hypothetical protein VMW34_08390 [Anaerolineales bacterium]|jgi:hypothetical protein|nr:hypothetical protein [Anaerolineales bacterium]HUV27371.1 hypothetical protein [Anaerolineales bacterium]